jgi:hypothetical protein
MASLLIYDAEVPPAARSALAAAYRAAPEDRPELLASAAHILRREAGVECADARELVDLAATT